MPNLHLSRLGWVGLGKETTLGTAVTPTIWVPATAIKPEDIPDYELDDSIAGNATKLRGLYLGYQDGQVSIDGRLYPEVIGPLLVAAGWADTVSGTTPTFTHTFKIPTSGAQPASYTLTINDNTTGNSRQYPGAIIDTLTIVSDAKGNMKYTSTWKTWPSVTVTTPTPTWTTSVPLMGWEGAPSIGGTAVGRLISAQMAIKRSTETPHTMNNTRLPYTTFAGPAEADWKVKAIMETESEWLHIINNDQPSLSVVFTSVYGTTPPVLTLTNTAAAWVKAPRDYTQKYVQLDADITGFYNSTDQGPVYATLLNSAAAAY